MSHPHDAVRVLPVSVSEDGSVRVFGLRYWSKEAVELAPRLVEIRISPAPHLNALLVSLSGERLCEVELVRDVGFASSEAAQEMAKRLRADRSSVVDRKVEALTQFIDHRIEMDRRANSSAFDHALVLYFRMLDRAKHMLGFSRGDVAEQHVLDRVDAVTELGEIIFGYRHPDLQCNQSAEASAKRLAAHRLCEGSK